MRSGSSSLMTTWSKSGRRTSGTGEPLHELRALARHARARDDEVEAGGVGAALGVGVDVRVDAERARLAQLAAGAQRPRRPRRRRSPGCRGRRSAPRRRRGRARSASPVSRASWPAARSMPSTLEPSSRSSKRATTDGHYWAAGGGTPGAPTPGAPTSASSRRGRCGSRAAQLAADAHLVEQPQRAVRRRRGGGVAELVGDEHPPVPVVVGVGLAVDLGDQWSRRRCSGPPATRRSSSMSVQSDGSESTISWKSSASGMIRAWSLANRATIPSLPPAGRASTGCWSCSSSSRARRRRRSCAPRWPPACREAMVLDELQREVERRLMRTRQFYDEWT